MRVSAPVFLVQDAAPRLILKPEFAFEMAQKYAECGGVVPADRRVDVDVIDRPVGATAGCAGDQASQLAGQIGGGEMTRFDKLNLLARFS